MNFDPLVPENWYSVSVGDALSEKVCVQEKERKKKLPVELRKCE